MNTDMDEKLKQYLWSIGDTEEDVAAFLASQGIRGVRRKAVGCPIAQLLSKQFGTKAFVSSYRAEIADHEGQTMRYRSWLSPAVERFVAAFDRGQFPELADPS